MSLSSLTILRLNRWMQVGLLLCLTASCTDSLKRTSGPDVPSRHDGADNPFDSYLHVDSPPADGFDFPGGRGNSGGAYVDKATGRYHDGWYVATGFAETYSLGIHPGEDWNGSGGANSDLVQDGFASGQTKVRDTFPGVASYYT